MERTFLIEILLVCYLHGFFGIRVTYDKSACRAGKFGNGCQYNCSSSCNFNKCIISHDKGVPECNKGCKEYHKGIFCQEFCPYLCLECDQTHGTCYKCIDGYYGETCNQMCDKDCLNGTCNIDGSCVSAPETGVQNKLKSANSEGLCLKMTEDGNVCQCCKMGRRGENCEQVCENCLTYYIPNKVCKYLCKDGFYGQTCIEECPEFCHQGHSDKPLCENTDDVLRCINGCKRGYTGLQCYNKCSKSCRLNTCYQMDGICVDCPNGKYGDMCFDICSRGCVNETCSRDGTCTDGCKAGMFGKSCNKTCPETCFTCSDDINTGLANCFSDCKTGYHGSLCQYKCNEGCQGNTCNKVDGRCVDGCKPGYYDIRCNKKCSEGCHGSTCTIEDGSCLAGCKIGFYRDNCTGICGINCVNNKCEDHFFGANPNVPFFCSEGCKNGYKGRSCNQTCSEHCMVCKQLSDDRCMKCDDGYNLKSNDDGHSSCLKTDPELAMLHVNLITIICTTVVSISITLVICKLLRRRKSSSFGPSLPCTDAGESHAEDRVHVNNVDHEPIIGNRGIMEQVSNKESRRIMEQVPLIENMECSDQGNNHLIQACRTGKLEDVKTILRHNKENINVRGRHGMTPIMEATGNGHTEVTEFLLKKGCDLSAVADNNKTLLHVACDRGNIGFVKDLLDKKLFDINAKGNMGRSPLLIAARIGNKDLFDLLMKEGADVYTKDDNNDTTLHVACYNDNAEFVRHLLTLGVLDIECKGCKGRSPAMIAAQNGCRKVFELLVEKGCDLTVRDEKSHNILTLACCTDNVAFVEYLLTLDTFDINTKGTKGRTPLLVAAKNDCSKVFTLLMLKGGDPSAEDDRGDSISSLARGECKQKLTKMNVFEEMQCQIVLKGQRKTVTCWCGRMTDVNISKE